MAADDSSIERALDRLGAVAHALTGRCMSHEVRTRFARYAALIELWNRTHNLTALRTPAEIVHGLFEDALLFLRVLPADATRVVDIGAGSGIPGVPLHLVQPGLSIVLIEARQKRVSFLKTLKRELALDDRVAIVEGRAETVIETDPVYRSSADAVVARGVGGVDRLMPIAARYLKAGGVFITSGRPGPDAAVSDQVRRTIVELPEFKIQRAFLLRAS